jgi:O-antigen ligase
MGLVGVARLALPILVGLFGFFTPFTIAGAQISLALACVALVADPQARAHSAALIRRHPIMRPLLAWCIVSVLAAVFAIDVAPSVEKLKKLALLPLILLGALPSVRARLRPILGALIASAAIVSAWGLVTFVRAGGGLDARLAGIHGFYMTVAGILMVVAILCLAELACALKDPHPRRITFLAVSGALVLVALLATYTRGSWIGFGAGALWLFRRRWAVLVGLFIAASLFFALGPPDARDRLFSVVNPAHPRNVERVLIWRHGLGLLKERPLTGLGLVIPNDRMQGELVTKDGTYHVHSHMHDAYLQVAVSMGWPALLVFLWLLVGLFRLGRAAPRGGIRNLWEEGLVAAYPATVIALAVNGLFEWNFGDSEILGLLWLLTGCVLGIATGSGD